MSGSAQNMLTLSELYFTDGDGSYRFQWSNQAFIFDREKPDRNDYNLYDDEEYAEYIIDLARYDLVQKHLNDGSQNAASYKITIYDKDTGNVAYTQTLSGCSVDVELDEGEYLWEVEAYDAQGNLITSSGRAYIYAWCDDWSMERIDEVDCDSSSASFNVYEGTRDYAHNAYIGRVSSNTEDKDFYFLISGPADPGEAWNAAAYGGYMVSTNKVDESYDATGNCLIGKSGIYEYENGQWNYKAFVNLEFGVSDDPMSEKDYLYTDGGAEGNKLYKWDPAQNKIVEVLTASDEIYYISDEYYNTRNGVFSIADNSLVLSYQCQYGECPVYDDLFFNIFAKNSSGRMQDQLEKGERGSIVVKYFFFDEVREQTIEKEMTLFSGTAWGELDTEEIFDERIGNCITYILEDEDGDADLKTAIVHEIGNDGSVTEHRFNFIVSGEADAYFDIEDEQLVLKYWKNGTLLTENFDVELDFDELFTDRTLADAGNQDGISFSCISGSKFVAEYSLDGFASVLRFETQDECIDTYGLPAGKYSLRISGDGGDVWVNCKTINAENATGATQFVSDADGNLDVFFAKASGIWSVAYSAEHQGSVYGWDGTREKVSLKGKNKIADVFTGSNDANILVLTDAANGDALFIDDIYTEFGNDDARFSQIQEIRAGSGNDIIDMTSQQFYYTGSGITIRGGAGDDVIWAAGYDNKLFGDAGNDRIIGSYGDDIIVGGSGNDSMHGGGGDDTFCFGGNWGCDTVEQLEGGSVTLYFESGSIKNWDALTFTYTDGSNSVTVKGTTQVELVFGGSAPVDGAFADSTSEKIFENNPDWTPDVDPVPTPDPTPVGTQYFGTKVYSEKQYGNYSDKRLDAALKTAVVAQLQASDGADTAISNAGTFSYFANGLDFGGGNDTLIVSESVNDVAAEGCWFNGDLNFGSGNNRVEAYAWNGGIYADNLYFGDGNNTVICVESEFEIGVKEYDSWGEVSYFGPDSGDIVFGNGSNSVIVDCADFEASNITFGNGGNSLDILNGAYFASCAWYSEDDWNENGWVDGSVWWDRIVEYNGGISKITFGSGADKINISGTCYDEDEGDCAAVLETFELDMGGGNDSITVGNGGLIYLDSCVNDDYEMQGGSILMGDGDDTFTLQAGGEVSCYGTLDMGAGNDTLVIDYGADFSPDGFIDFGAGYDTLELNGTLTVWGDYVLQGVENVVGNGTLVITDYAEEEFIRKFENAGITVIA